MNYQMNIDLDEYRTKEQKFRKAMGDCNHPAFDIFTEHWWKLPIDEE